MNGNVYYKKRKGCFAFLMAGMFCIMIILAGCDGQNQPAASGETAGSGEKKQMVFVKLPSPPTCKKTTDLNKIETIMSYINQADRKPMEASSSPEGGWYLLLKVTEHGKTTSISVLNQTLSVDGKLYEVDHAFQEELVRMYEQLDEPEEAYS